jgi:predicted RNA methylase
VKLAPSRKPRPGLHSIRSPRVATRPELDHGVPCVGQTTSFRVLDRDYNLFDRRRFRNEVRGRDSSRGGTAPCSVKGSARQTDTACQVSTQTHTAARQLDQFYTKGKLAARYLKRLGRRYDLGACVLLEPSSGAGAFSKQMPVSTIALDIDPKGPGIVKANFLEVQIISESRIVIVGNPPFGKNACLAVRFFNHAAWQSHVIAMIFPRSFLKSAIENHLNGAFHLVHCEEVPPNSFELNGECRDVGAVFQIWERRAMPRMLRSEEISHADFKFTVPDFADFVIRRVGANAGEIRRVGPNAGEIRHGRDVHEKSYYFIKGDVEHIIRQLDLAGAARNATSTPSLAKSEIVALYRQYVERPAKSRHTQAELAQGISGHR